MKRTWIRNLLLMTLLGGMLLQTSSTGCDVNTFATTVGDVVLFNTVLGAFAGGAGAAT